MISLTDYDFQWARSELVIFYPDAWIYLEETDWSKGPWEDLLGPAMGRPRERWW